MMLFVHQLEQHGVVESPMHPVHARVAEENEEWILRNLVPQIASAKIVHP